MTMRVSITIKLSTRSGVSHLLAKLFDTLLPPIWKHESFASVAVKRDSMGVPDWETVQVANNQAAKAILLRGLEANGVACYPAAVWAGHGAVWAKDDAHGGARVTIDFDRDLQWQDDQQTIPAVDADMRHITEILKAAQTCGLCGFEWSCND